MVRRNFTGLGIGDADISGVLKKNPQFRSEKMFRLKLIKGLANCKVRNIQLVSTSTCQPWSTMVCSDAYDSTLLDAEDAYGISGDRS